MKPYFLRFAAGFFTTCTPATANDAAVAAGAVPTLQEVPVLTPSLADELLQQLPVNRETAWTPGGLGLDLVAFNAVAQRVLELETQGAVDVINLGRETYSGSARLTAIRFMRLA